MKLRNCRICGRSFIPTSSRQLDCKQPIMRKCKVCGKEFAATCSQNDLKSTCSAECNKRAGADSRKQLYSKQTKVCELCGKEFHPTSNTQKYCKTLHEATCKVCGKEYFIDTKTSDRPVTCSKECGYIYRDRNGNRFADPEFRKQMQIQYKEKTGYDHPMHNPEVVAKMKATNLERYGSTSYTQTEEYKEQAIHTNLEKYGCEWPLQNEDIKKKLEETFLSAYGVTNAMQIPGVSEKLKSNYKEKTGYIHPGADPSVREKAKQTMIEKYGVDSPFKSEEIQNKIHETMLNRYGVDNALQSEEIKQKVATTNLERYGVECYLASEESRSKLKSAIQSKYDVDAISQSAAWKMNIMMDPTKIENWTSFLSDPETYLETFYKTNSRYPKYTELSSDLGVSDTTISMWVNLKGLQNKVQYTLSKGEDEIVAELRKIDPTLTICRHERKLIPNKELDIYLPNEKLAIEFNPTATHNSSIHDPWGSDPKSYNYHQTKTQMCEDRDVFLFHIFGSEWTYQREIMISMLRNVLHKNQTKIYARECDIKEVSASDSKQFLEENHRQGNAAAPIRYGLFYNDKLVSLMTFGKMRPSIGTSNKENLDNCYELVRFCSITNTSVVGGADKLFKHFIKEYSPNEIRSFSDRAHTKGNLYKKLGFEEMRRSDPGYIWIDTRTDISYHRYNAQKQNIKQFLKDDSIDLSKTETQIMIEHGFVQMFDSGTILWKWANL